MTIDKIKECFFSALRDEKNDRKHKGLLLIKPNREEVLLQYEEMMALCKKAIAQCEEIVFSKKEYKLPAELVQLIKI